MNRSPHLVRALGALAVTALMVSGCTAPQSEKDSDGKGVVEADSSGALAGFVGEQPEGATPAEGGTVSIAEFGEPASLDPADTMATGSTGGNAMINIYDVLLKLDAKSEELEPQLAESLEPNDDFTNYTLTLRDGVKFSDGTDLDAQAVVDSIQHYIDDGGNDATALTANMKSMKATASDTVEFTMSRPWAKFPTLLSQGAGMIVAPAGYKNEEDFKPIGAGPYVLDRHAPAEEMVLTANPDYWGGKPAIDTLRMIWPYDGEARLELLDSDQVQVAYLREPQLIGPAIQDGKIGNLAIVTSAYLTNINHREGHPTADPRIREAITLAIDPQLVFDRAFNGEGLPSRSLFPEGTRWATGEKQSVDKERARELVAEAKKDGISTKLVYGSNGSPDGRAQALALKALLEDVGFEIDIYYTRSVAETVQRIYIDHDFDIAVGSSNIEERDPSLRLTRDLSSTSLSNTTGYSSPEMDALLLELQAAPDQESTQAVLDKINEQFEKDRPWVPLGASQIFLAQSPKLYDIQPTTAQMMLFDEAWLSE